MIFCGSYEVERLIVHPTNNVDEAHYIEIEKNKDAPIFSVTYCCDDEWIWEFMYSKTNYEVVKYLIMDSIVVCDTVEELIDMLDEVFAEECDHMICEGYEMECDGDCECCDCCGEEEEEEDYFECDGDCVNCEHFYED